MEEKETRGKVMIVDDEPDIANFLAELLELKGCRTKYFFDSLQALDNFRNMPDDIDMVIMDQTMPNMTGLELAKEMLSIRADLPVIIISGYNDVLNEDNFGESGVSAYLKKPFRSAEIMELVDKYCGS